MVLQQMKINKIEQGVEDVYLICMDEDINFNRHIYVIISGPNYPIVWIGQYTWMLGIGASPCRLYLHENKLWSRREKDIYLRLT